MLVLVGVHVLVTCVFFYALNLPMVCRSVSPPPTATGLQLAAMLQAISSLLLVLSGSLLRVVDVLAGPDQDHSLL
jgi:hypothetical protein